MSTIAPVKNGNGYARLTPSISSEWSAVVHGLPKGGVSDCALNLLIQPALTKASRASKGRPNTFSLALYTEPPKE
jgi:hypothetical protein